MRRIKSCEIAVVAVVFAICGCLTMSAHGDVRLPHIIADGMVLQRDIEVPIWGWAEPGEEVAVTMADHKATAKADAAGKWLVRLPAMKAGGPHGMTVAGKNTIELKDILVGEVWICSGQSNMDMGIRSVNRGEQEVAEAKFPQIRLFRIGYKTAPAPQEDVDAQWKPCSPDNIGTGGFFNVGFSAVAYFFGRELHKELNVPIGLIQSAWGGSRIEPWTPPVGFAAVESLKDIVKTIDSATPNFDAAVKKTVEDIRTWLPGAEKTVAEGKPVAPPPAWPKHQLDDMGQPTGIYNAMIHPLVPLAIRGAIWYQGESNAPEGMAYCDKMKALIGGWRKIWGQGDFPFYYVQIAPLDGQAGLYKAYADDQLPRLWEAQTAALAIPNTGMVVTNDISDLADIHPKNKQDVGKRLALWALAKTYGRTGLVCSGPLYKSMAIEADQIRVRFDYLGAGLASRDGKPLTWFAVAGEDHKFVDAQAVIDGDTVVVRSEQVPKPVAVRFAWSMTAQPNLMNKEGLPASAFRTDRW